MRLGSLVDYNRDLSLRVNEHYINNVGFGDRRSWFPGKVDRWSCLKNKAKEFWVWVYHWGYWGSGLFSLPGYTLGQPHCTAGQKWPGTWDRTLHAGEDWWVCLSPLSLEELMVCILWTVRQFGCYTGSNSVLSSPTSPFAISCAPGTYECDLICE